LTAPWQKKTGRPKSCGLYQAVEVACMYLRHNATQEFIGDLRDISQSTVSRIITVLVPMIEVVLEEFVPDAKDAIRLVKGKVCLERYSKRAECAGPSPLSAGLDSAARLWNKLSVNRRSGRLPEWGRA
jgi:hypothetical protein